MPPRRHRFVVTAFPHALLWVWCCCSGLASAGEPTRWDFRSDTAGWQPRATSGRVERITTQGPDHTPTPCLHIGGRIDGGWNYATSANVPMTAGQAYRLSAWMRVDRLGPGTPPPYLKCEFLAKDRSRHLGRAKADAPDAAPLGTWQRLVGEFRAPDGTQHAWLALEKGTDAPTEIDACLADVRLEPIAGLSRLESCRLKPLPASLEKVRNVHPRLYLTSQRIEELRRAAKTTSADLWKKVQEQADRAVRQGPPVYIERDRQSGDEQLWQRTVGNTMPVLAMAYVVTGEKQYLEAARRWALASCEYKTWGLGRYDGMDLSTGHQLFGLAIIYDWCYRDLDEPARRQIRGTLAKRTSAMFEAAATGKASWHRAYLQNHLWVNITGMAASGIALFDEVEEAACWIGLPLDKYRRTMAALGPDGASHEGVGYWEYGVEYMLKFMDLARQRLDVDLYGGEWWRNTALYAQYLTLPRKAWTRNSCIVDLADCPRGHWYGPEYLLRALAHEYRDGYAQWLAQQIDETNVAAANATWLNLIWFDPAVPVKSPESLPTLHHFQDMGIVSARSGWSGEESLLVFKCGPFIGHEAMAKFSYDPGGGHVHPDANHFVLFGRGQWLIRDDGYHPKWSAQHNTLLIDDRGQLGERGEWFNGSQALALKSRPKVLRAVSTATIDHVSGDAAEAYPRELGLKRFVRHLIFVKPDVLIVADEVLLDRKADLELRFHSEQPAEAQESVFVSKGRKATLHIEPLTTERVQASSEMLPLPGRRGDKEGGMSTVRLRTRQQTWRNAVALSWCGTEEKPAKVSLRADGLRWTFTVKDHKLVLDWETGRAE